MSSTFDEFFTDAPAGQPQENFLSPTFSTFTPEQVYFLEVTKVSQSESEKTGFIRLQLSVDAVDATGNKESMGNIWVPTPEPIANGDVARALQGDVNSQDYKDAAKMRNMYGRFLFDFLKSIAPDKFYMYKLDKVGKKTVAVSTQTGAELAKEDREAIDQKLSSAVAAFSSAAIHGKAADMLIGKRFAFKQVPNKKNPQYANDVFLTPDQAV